MNEPIGTVECPHKKCAETCNVYRFRKRAGDEKLTRFGGKLYADCPKHGRIGADAKEATQEYLLCHAKMNGPKNGGAGETPAPSKTAPAKPAVSTTPSSKTSGAPGSGAPVTPAPRPWWAPVIA